MNKGKTCVQISEFLYLDDDTIQGWYKTYRKDGWDALALDGWQGGHSRLTSDQEAKLSAWLEGRFCRSAGEIRAYITTKFSLRYSQSSCLKLLRRLGFEYCKPKALPHVAAEEKQADFIASYEALLTNFPAVEAVYFADAVPPNTRPNPPLVGCVRAQNLPYKPPQGGDVSTSMGLSAWRTSTRLLLSPSRWMATARCSSGPKSKQITRPNRLFT